MNEENSPINPVVEIPPTDSVGKIDHLSTNEKLNILNAPIASRFNPPTIVDQEPKDSEEDLKFSLEQIDADLRDRLSLFGVSVEVVESLMNLAMYDDSEKKLLVRQDADAEHINNYIKDVVLPNFNNDTDIEPEVGVGTVRVEKEKEIEDGESKFVWENKDDDFMHLGHLRVLCVKNDLKSRNGGELTEEEKGQIEEYKKFKEYMALQIRKSKEADMPETMSEEEKSARISEINDYIFDVLVRNENNRYLIYLKYHQGLGKEGFLDKGLEAAKSLLGTKAVKWYLGLSKNSRRALSFGVGGMVGLVAGAAVAPGMVGVGTYLAWRAARFGVSGLASSKASEWANNRWSLEDLEAEKNKAVEDLKNTNLSLEEKSKGLRDIEENFKKAKIILSAKKIGTTIAAGAGAGMLTGLVEGLTTTVNASANVTGVAPRASNLRVTIEPSIPPIQKPLDIQLPGPKVPEGAVFENESVLRHEVKTGDSTWKLLGDIVEKSKSFKNISSGYENVPQIIEAKKSFIISNLINENNLASGGPLKVGDEVDFTKVFEDKEKIKELFKKAEELSNEKILNIWTNNEKIASWIKTHPGENLTQDKVGEILSQKIEPKTFVFNQETAQPTPLKSLDETINRAGLEEPKLTDSNNELNAQNVKVIDTLDPSLKKDTGEAKVIGGVSYGQNEVAEEFNTDSNATMSTVSTEKVANIEDYRNGGIRSMQGDSRRLVAEIVSNEKVEEHLRMDINNIYGKKGIFGIGKVEGVNTKEWQEISGQNAAKVIDFYNNPDKSELPKKIIEKLTVSQEDRNLVEYIDFLRGEARTSVSGFVGINGGDVAPYENETVADYLRRLGKFIMEHPKPEVQKDGVELKRVA